MKSGIAFACLVALAGFQLACSQAPTKAQDAAGAPCNNPPCRVDAATAPAPNTKRETADKPCNNPPCRSGGAISPALARKSGSVDDTTPGKASPAPAGSTATTTGK